MQKKVNGQKLYSLARAGKEIERQYNRVCVSWKNVRLTDEKTITFTLCGSCGTYVRSLGYMLAKKLGTVGHLTQLRRLEIGPYRVDNAFDGAKLKQAHADELFARILPI